MTSLDLRGNEIEDEGAKALAEALLMNKSVTDFNLDGNYVGDEGAKALAEALIENDTLTY